MYKSNQQRNKKQRRARNGNNKTDKLVPNQIYAPSFPQQMKVTMAYYDTHEISLSSGLANDYMYRLNSIYDPNITSVGHQPQGHDQWNQFYNRYRVDSVIAEVTWPYVTADGASINCVILANNSVTPITLATVANESPLGKSGDFTTGSKPLKLRRRYDLAVINGVSRTKYLTDDTFSAVFGGNPNENLTLHVITSQVSPTADAFGFTIKLLYEVTMFDPITLGVS